MVRYRRMFELDDDDEAMREESESINSTSVTKSLIERMRERRQG